MDKLLKMNSNTSGNTFLNLYAMVSQLSTTSLPLDHERTIVNDIPGSLKISANQHKVALVISRLLAKVADHAAGSDINVSAKTYGNVTLLHFKNKSRLNSPEFANSLVNIQELAEELNGNVCVTSYRNDITTVAFSFMNIKEAA
jgi:hypothetical protein